MPSPPRSVPAEFYPAPGSELFDARTPRNGTTIEANSDFTSICSYTMNPGTWGICKGFGQGVAASAAWSNFEWSFRINKLPIIGYESIYDQISAISRPVFLFRAIQSGDLIELFVRNLSTTTSYVAYGRILGWYYLGDQPIADELYDQAHGEF